MKKSKIAKIKGIPPDFIIKAFATEIKERRYTLLSHKPEQVLLQYEDWFTSDQKTSLYPFKVKEAIKIYFSEGISIGEQVNKTKTKKEQAIWQTLIMK